MLGRGTRDARRTERYLDELMAADERRAPDVPVDVDMDPAVRLAAARSCARIWSASIPRSGSRRLSPARLAAAALRLRAGLPMEAAGRRVPAVRRGRWPPSGALAGRRAPRRREHASPATADGPHVAAPASALRRLPEMAARQSRPLIVGGVGVASAAISIGAVYVAWRHSRPASGRMGRAVRAAHGRTAQSGPPPSGVIHGILGVVS